MQSNNTSQNIQDDEEETAYMYAYLAIRVLFSLLSISGNSLTLIAIIRYTHLQKMASNCLVASLACADLVNSLNVYFLFAINNLNGTKFWKPVCLTSEIINMTSTGGNVLTILAISIERYICIGKIYSYSINIFTYTSIYSFLLKTFGMLIFIFKLKSYSIDYRPIFYIVHNAIFFKVHILNRYCDMYAPI